MAARKKRKLTAAHLRALQAGRKKYLAGKGKKRRNVSVLSVLPVVKANPRRKRRVRTRAAAKTIVKANPRKRVARRRKSAGRIAKPWWLLVVYGPNYKRGKTCEIGSGSRKIAEAQAAKYLNYNDNKKTVLHGPYRSFEAAKRASVCSASETERG